MVKACYLANPVHTKDPTPSYDELVVVCVEVRLSVTVSVITILPHQRFLTMGPKAEMGPWLTQGSMKHKLLPDIDTTIQVATASNLHTHPLQ